MNKKLASSSVAFVLLLLAVIPAIATASAPPLPPEPTSLPSIPYMYNGTIYNVVSSDWITDINTVYNSKSYVSYNWTGNATEDLILFDLSYTGLNPYGQQIIEKMSEIGAPSTANFTKAFNQTKNLPSQVKDFTNVQALDSGAYPGFSWSVPKIKKPVTEDIYVGVLVAIVASIFVLYFIFNRRR